MTGKFSLFTLIAISATMASLLALSCGKSDKRTDAIRLPAQQSQTGAIKPDSSAHADNAVEMIDSLDELISIVEGTPGKLLVFDLYADWCRPCIMLAPTFSKLASDYSKHARFFRIDIQKNPEITSAFRVRSIPLVVFIKDKEVVHSVSGLKPREDYERVITACGPSVSVAECRTKLEERL